MNFKKILQSTLFTTVILSGIAACGCSEDTTVGTFDFTISLESGKSALEVGQTDYIVVSPNEYDNEGKTYTIKVNKSEYATYGDIEGLKFPITAVGAGSAVFTVTETTTGKTQRQPVTIISSYDPANGGYNFASVSGKEAVQTRTKILGELEKYAVDSHLTGITLFENGGYAKYSSRLDIPAKEYITGYGFGILSEGKITAPLKGATDAYKWYYHSAQTSNPGKINAMDDTGSQVSDLASYVTSTFWGTELNEFNNAYKWYPVLAKDKIGDKVNDRPIPVYEGEANPLGLYKRWRVYVKTGADGLKYRTNGIFKANWDNKPVELKDYEFTLKMLLTGANQLARGSETAADKSYGIKGAQSFYTRTTSTSVSQEFVDNTWDKMKEKGELGVETGTDANGSYIEIELVHEIDDFTAMYTLSSSLYSPLPQAFVQMLGYGEVKNGAKVYGEAKESFNNNGTNVQLSPNDTTLSLGAMYLEKWTDEFIAFKRNETWIESKEATSGKKNNIEGVKITTYRDAQEDPDALYRAFYADALDSCGVPTQHITEETTSKLYTNGGEETRTLITKGDSTFKLNVNSCTQERWDYLFGKNGKICVTDDASKYVCKPWMSNDNFLNGLYWSINRAEFAKKRGVQPSISYLSNSYLSDPEAGESYNDTPEHKKAIEKMHNVTYDDAGKVVFDDYGYNRDKAINYFKKAVKELKATGTIKDGDTISISINWMYQTDITEYGQDIAKYFTDAFNDKQVSNGKITLVVDQPSPSSDWQAVYNEVMMKGRFDLAFGAISGNTYNPLNFLEVLKSDNSSGFTLNWGPDTSKIDDKHPIVYNESKYSFDALWEVADHGGIVKDGAVVSPIKNCYLEMPKDASGNIKNELENGFTVDIPMEFVDVENIELDVSKIALFVVNGDTHDVNYTYDKANKLIKVTIDAETAAAIDAEIKTAQKMTDPNKTDTYKEHPFQRAYYNKFWNFELTYTLSIAGGTPAANTVNIALEKDSQKY